MGLCYRQPYTRGLSPITTGWKLATFIFTRMSIPVWEVKLAKFICVGISGACIDLGVTYLLKEKAKWNRYLANSAGFSLAVINNFFLNRAWTFAGSSTPLAIELETFAFITIIWLGINNLSLYIMHSKLHINFYLVSARKQFIL